MRNHEAWVKSIKESYPPGTRIRLDCMSDPYCPIPRGTEGEVTMVDDMGTLHMKWDNGRSLGVVPGEDQFTVLSRPQEQKAEEASESPPMGGMKFE